MKTEVKKLEGNKIELNVEISAEVFNKSIANAYKTLSNKISIPGFRKGKIPARVIDSKVGKGAVYEEAIKSSINEYYNDAVKESGCEPIDRPDIEITDVDEEKGLSFKANVDVKPEIKLGNYKDIKLEKKKVEISDTDVDKQIKEVSEKFASVEPVQGKLAEKGDYVLINFDGTIDGKPFEGGSAKNYMLEIGSNTLMPEFEEQLIGAKAGEIKDISIHISENHDNKEIADKNIKFRVLIKEVKIKKLPEINDEFVKEQLGEFENLTEFKKEIKNGLKKQHEEMAESQYRTEILDLVAEKAKVEIPKKLIDDEIDQLLADFEYGLKIRGADLESYLKMTDQKQETLRENFKNEAEVRVKRNLVIEAVAESENIQPSEIEVNNEIKKLYDSAQRKKESPQQSYKDFKKNLEVKGFMEYLIVSLKHRKTLDFLENQAQSNVS